MTAALCPSFRLKFFTKTFPIRFLAAGKVYSYVAGGTIPKATYTTSAGNVELSNPIILDENGEREVWLGTGAYRFDIYSSTNVLQYTIDNITSNASNGSTVVTVENIEDLRQVNAGEYQNIYVASHTDPEDDGGGMFFWDSGSVLSDNNGTVVTPSSSPSTGRWIRNNPDRLVNLLWFGPDSEATADTALTSAITESATTGYNLYIPDGEYILDGTHVISSDVTILNGSLVGEGEVTILSALEASNSIHFGDDLTVNFSTSRGFEYDLSWFGTLANAVSKIGTVKATLYISQNYTHSTTVTTPVTLTIKILNGAIVGGAGTLTILSEFDADLTKCFETTLNLNLFAVKEASYPQWWGGFAGTTLPVPGDPDSGDAIQAAIDSITLYGGIVKLTTGFWGTNIGITLPSSGCIFTGSGQDTCRLKYIGTDFVDIITVGVEGSQTQGVEISNICIQGGAFLHGLTRWCIYAHWFNSGCRIQDVQLRDSVGMIRIKEAFLSTISNLQCGTTAPNRAAAGITQAEWLEVHGPGRAPVMICRANATTIDTLTMFRIGSEVSDGITPFAYCIIGGGAGSFNNISLESCGTYTNGGDTFNLRAQVGFSLGSAASATDDEQCSCVINGCYMENNWVTTALLKTWTNTKTEINGIFWYNIWSDTYMFDNWGAGDLHLNTGDIYRARCPTLEHVLGSTNAVSRGAVVFFNNVHLEAGERESEASLSGGAANLYNSASSLYPMGCADGDTSYPPTIQTPKIIRGYDVTQTTSGGLSIIQVGAGYYLNTKGYFVSNMHSSESNLPVWFWLHPDTASKYYRVFVGKAGQVYLTKYNSAPVEPKGDWLASFETDGANAIINLVQNPFISNVSYAGTYSPSGFITIYGTTAPVSGYWEIGARCFNSNPTDTSVLGWVCIGNGTPGTWRQMTPSIDTWVNSKAVNGDYVAYQIENSYDVSGSTSQSVSLAAKLKQFGSFTRNAGQISFEKLGDYDATASQDSKVGIYAAINNVNTKIADFSQEGLKMNAARILAAKGADVASATNLTLGNGNVFVVTGNTAVSRILNTGWTSGSVITLIVDSGPITFNNFVGASGSNADLRLQGNTNWVAAPAFSTLTLVFFASWIEVCRSVNT